MFLDVFLVLVMFLVATPLFGGGAAIAGAAAVDAFDEEETGVAWLAVAASIIGILLTLGSMALGIVMLVGLF